MPTSKQTFEVGIFVFYSAPAELASSDSAFATPVALLLFCPVVAMLHPLHSPLASGANPFALFLGAVEWRFFEAYSPASGFIVGSFFVVLSYSTKLVLILLNSPYSNYPPYFIFLLYFESLCGQMM